LFNSFDKAGQNMNAINGKYVLAAVAIAIAASSSITKADDQPVVYGRAGIPVAEQRIQQLSQVQSRDSAPNGTTVTWYGRAGFPTGSDAVTAAGNTPPTPKSYAAGETKRPTVFGRAGYALPFGS
jgi:hypothetical protein